MNPSPNLILVGPMGAGKSTIGRRLAQRFGLRFADADAWVEEAAGATVAQLFQREGEPAFRQREREALATLLGQDGLVLATGGGAVLDADNRALLQRRGFVVHLEVTVDRQLERLAQDHSRPLLARDDRAQVLGALATARNPLYAQTADLAFDTDALDPAAAADALGDLLAARWRGHGVAA
ncbi:shikimate kinase [Agrilutibacter solisilvae]|uniref:Shikimate kinase n=1 Tax=Agrilutibacter solisilvae TaxID=2763317 RepID=A0A974XZ87_9GAMM|nr:shikimate kinase [Lysobacter solisilvae]QSX78419.1 shikimate kinase [Lysobacter solisilvae]